MEAYATRALQCRHVNLDRAHCERLDRDDPLASFRDRFDVDDEIVYLDGNSLGRPPRTTVARVDELVGREWARGLVRSWTTAGWMESPHRVGAKLARLVGADEDEVLVVDSTTICLFKAMTAAMRARPQRSVILTEEANFPTDLYVAGGAVDLLAGRELRLVDRSAVGGALDESVCAMLLTHVDFRTGEQLDMSALTQAAHDAGALTIWDLSHSTGAVRLDLHAADADLAVGCGYKYLNGGPGAPAFLYVRRSLQAELANPVPGWLGHASPFTFEPAYRPAPGLRSWMTGSPPVLAIAALEQSVDLFLAADMRQLAEKSQQLTDLFIRLSDARLGPYGFEVASPRDAQRRGAQVSLRHARGLAIVQALIARGVIGDFRDPNLCRFGFAPIYTRYVDVWEAVERIVDVMESHAYEDPEYAERGYIT